MIKSQNGASETDRFLLEHLFFSRTDSRGVIQSANSTFAYVAAFEWAEMAGAPHKIIRHPDMPKAVFRLMWDTIQQGDPIAAYVVNQAKDGQYYWVYAVVSPIDGGFLSVRLKPTSPRLDTIKAAYKTLRAAENGADYSIEQGVEQLLHMLKGLGFSSYSEFMTACLRDEMAARNAGLGRPPDRRLPQFSAIETAIRATKQSVVDLRLLFTRSMQIPYNMRLQASRVEGSDGPLSVVSSNYKTVSSDLSLKLDTMADAAEFGAAPIFRACFVNATGVLFRETLENFSAEPMVSQDRRDADMEALQRLCDDTLNQSYKSVKELLTRIRGFSQICKGYRRAMSGLEMTRMMCQIERSNLTGDVAGLDEITAQLLKTEREMMAVIVKIENQISTLTLASQSLEVSQSSLRKGPILQRPAVLEPQMRDLAI